MIGRLVVPFISAMILMLTGWIAARGLPGLTPAAVGQTQDRWRPVVYAYRNPATGVCTLNVNEFLLRSNGKTRTFVFGSLWRFNVSSGKWEKTGLRVEGPVLLKAEERQVYSSKTDREIATLTGDVGLFWAEWKEDGREAQSLVFSGPILCEDVMIGEPPKGMIATCVQSPTQATAMFVPDPKIHCKP